MPRSVTIDPGAARASGSVSFTPIPLNQYDRSISDELSAGGIERDDLLAIQRDMVLLRAFEVMLNDVKTQGNHAGIEYLHPGPAHLSIGQEASAVGQAFLLDADDHIFGSHRSHGECLAKGLSVIERMDDDTLMRLMKSTFDGAALRIVEKDAEGSVKDLAIARRDLAPA